MSCPSSSRSVWTSALWLVFAFAGAGCLAADPESLSSSEFAATVDEASMIGCSTAVVLALSEQIADEMVCLAPGMLVRFEESDKLVFASDAVIPLVSPEARDGLLAAVSAGTDELMITSAFRSVAQQYVIYRWFQAGTCSIAAAAQPGRSNHETGRAIDIGNYTLWAPSLPMFGWVQTVLPSDPVHFEHLDSPDLRGLDVHAFQRLWNRNHPEDLIDEDGDFGPQTEARLGQSPAEGFAVGPCRATGPAVELTVTGAPFEIASGEQGEISIFIRNTGSTDFGPGDLMLATSSPRGRDSEFVDPHAWNSASEVVVLGVGLASGEVAVVSMPLLAPSVEQSTSFNEAFAWVDSNGVEIPGGDLSVDILVTTDLETPGGGCGDCRIGSRGEVPVAPLALAGLVVVLLRPRRRTRCR